MGKTEDHENNLYHFTNLDTFFKIFPAFQLRANPIINTNDPRENKSWYFPSSNPNGIKKLHPENNVFSIISKKVRTNVNILCFSTDLRIDFKHKDLEERRLWEFGYNIQCMWAHYADNHKGVCLKINKDKFEEENKNILDSSFFSKNVNYSNKTKLPFVDFEKLEEKGIDEFSKQFRNENREFFFFNKQKSWESESEFRYIQIDTPNPTLLSIKNSIESVILGVDFDSAYIDSLRKVIPNTEIMRTVFFNENFATFELENA